MSTATHVVREVNLIARNLECWGKEAAILATADHLRRFWAPSLKQALFEQARTDPDRLSPIARGAVAMLTAPAAAAAHSGATPINAKERSQWALAKSC